MTTSSLDSLSKLFCGTCIARRYSTTWIAQLKNKAVVPVIKDLVQGVPSDRPGENVLITVIFLLKICCIMLFNF